jgi:hypothetical protein
LSPGAAGHRQALIPVVVFGLLLVVAATLWYSTGSRGDQEPITS